MPGHIQMHSPVSKSRFVFYSQNRQTPKLFLRIVKRGVRQQLQKGLQSVKQSGRSLALNSTFSGVIAKR